MILIFGGAYQGKLDFAKKEFGIEDRDVLNMTELCAMAIDKNDQDLNYGVDGVIEENLKTAGCIYGLDTYIRFLQERGIDSDSWIESRLCETNYPEEKIVIMGDVSQGLVPLDPEERKFREANGRAMIKLSAKAHSVYRVFCGIGTRIK